MPTALEASSALSLPHERFIRFRLPDWLKNATPQERTDLREALIQCHLSAIKVGDILSPLKSLDDFAEPILEMDLKAGYPQLRDMQIATISKRWYRDSVMWIPIYDASPEHSLLEAALYNFEAWETRSSGFGSGSAIYLTGKSAGLKSNLLPEVFALRCRNLDLGRRYLLHLKQVLDLTNPANEPLVPQNKHQHFAEHQRNRFNVILKMAHLRGDISDDCARRLKYFLLAPDRSRGKLLLSHRVKLLGHVLPGVIHFAADPDDDKGRCAIYFPGHPLYPLREYSSLLMFQVVFMTHLNSQDARRRISRLMPIDYRDNLLTAKLRSAISAANAPQASQVSLSSWIEEELFEDIHRQLLSRALEDLGRLAPPAANVQAAQREKLLDDYQTSGLELLPTLKDYIPQFKRRLAEPVDILDAALVYQDLETWNIVERLSGSIHLLNVVEAQASSQITPQMHTEASTLPELVSVRTRSGTRLWHPDPSHYRVALHLPNGQWHMNALGLHDWANKTYLLLNQSYYEVRYDTDTQGWHIVSQDKPELYSPPLKHNRVGAWWTLHENILQWPEAKLINRLSARAARLPEPLANALLSLSGENTDTLRQLHRHGRRTPPLLLDSLKRLWILREIEGFNIDQPQDDTCSELCSQIQTHLPNLLPDLPKQAPVRIAKQNSRRLILGADGAQFVNIDEIQWLPELFDYLYRQLEQPETPSQQRLRDAYPDLPKSHLEELDLILQTLEQSETTLPGLQPEIDRALEQVRISRVFEGLYPEWPKNQHSEYLAFSLLETLEPWPEDLRLELMDPALDLSTPLQSIGVDFSLNYRRLRKTASRYETQDRQGRTLSTHADFYSALWQTLPTATQKHLSQAYDISLEAGQTAIDLKRALFRQASKLRRQTPAVRMLHPLPEPAMTSSAGPLPEQFAVPGRLVSGLQLRDNGIYWNLNRETVSSRAHRHYIVDRRRYYPVRWSPEGWRLLNASNPYSFYQPRLQRKSKRDHRWTLHHPDREPRLLVQSEHLPVPTDSQVLADLQPGTMFTPEQWQRLLANKSYRSHTNSPFAYDPVDNARYPLRDLDGHPMTITALYYSVAEDSPQTQARAQQIIPYLAQGVEVARLYENKLRILRFKEQHMASADERHLLYRFRVSPRHDLNPGELLGVYGGMLIPLIVNHHRRDPFTTWIQDERSLNLLRFHGPHPQSALPCLTGDNMLSRINTIFEYHDGIPVRQAATGYNVEAFAFPVDIQDSDGSVVTNRYYITALFTSQAVKADEELRMNHGYTWEQIQTLNSTEPVIPDMSEPS